MLDSINKTDLNNIELFWLLQGRHCELPGAYACIDVEAQVELMLQLLQYLELELLIFLTS